MNQMQDFGAAVVSETEQDIKTKPDSLAGKALSMEERLEALLFISAHPVTVRELSNALQESSRKVIQALEALELQFSTRGIRLQKHRSGYQLTTAPDVAADIERLLNLEDISRISRAALEALAIIAYQQPVTRPQIDSIRGVNSDSVLKTLLRHGLIEESGRSISPGRPILYSTTSEFLQHFGLNAIKELPPLDPDMMLEIHEPEISIQDLEG